MQLDSTTMAAITLLVIMAALSVALGVYLVFTNPPKDRSKFVGFRAEKMTDEEVDDLVREER